MHLVMRVKDGPSDLIGRTGSLVPTMATSGVLIRPFGRIDLLRMFGEFDGLNLISRTHLMITFDSKRPQVDVRDPGSKNGTIPGDCLVGESSQELELAGVITLELCCGQRPVEAPMPSSESMDEWMRYITGSVRAFTESVGWTYQVRRSWHARDKPAGQLVLRDHEWKIVPSLDEIERRGWDRAAWAFQQIPSSDEVIAAEVPEDGLYYVISPSEETKSFALVHSNDRRWPPNELGGVEHWLRTWTIIPFDLVSRGPDDLVQGQWSKGTLEQYIGSICHRFMWNHYSAS